MGQKKVTLYQQAIDSFVYFINFNFNIILNEMDCIKLKLYILDTLKIDSLQH